MKKFKYNLVGINGPDGYRFLLKGDKFEIGDTWWVSAGGMTTCIVSEAEIRSLDRHNARYVKCGYPNKSGSIYFGYVRKI